MKKTNRLKCHICRRNFHGGEDGEQARIDVTPEEEAVMQHPPTPKGNDGALAKATADASQAPPSVAVPPASAASTVGASHVPTPTSCRSTAWTNRPDYPGNDPLTQPYKCCQLFLTPPTESSIQTNPQSIFKPLYYAKAMGMNFDAADGYITELKQRSGQWKTIGDAGRWPDPTEDINCDRYAHPTCAPLTHKTVYDSNAANAFALSQGTARWDSMPIARGRIVAHHVRTGTESYGDGDVHISL